MCAYTEIRICIQMHTHAYNYIELLLTRIDENLYIICWESIYYTIFNIFRIFIC